MIERRGKTWLFLGLGGVLAGLTLLAVGTWFDQVEAQLPAIGAEYGNKLIFRPWPGWSARYMFLHPLWFGFVFTAGYVATRGGVCAANWRAALLRGAAYGGGIFLVGSAPIFALMYASLNLSPTLLLVSWAARNATQYVCAGGVLGLLDWGLRR